MSTKKTIKKANAAKPIVRRSAKAVRRFDWWAAKQPTGVTHIFKNRPEKSPDDGFWFDDTDHSFIVLSGASLPINRSPKKIHIAIEA